MKQKQKKVKKKIKKINSDRKRITARATWRVKAILTTQHKTELGLQNLHCREQQK